MTTWEYKHFNCKLSEKELNDLGAEGWELVAHTAVYVGELKQYYVFKRRLQ